MELRHIRYFSAVAEELHMGRAAARLHIGQPALSKQIAALERELKLKLFDRSQGRLVLTPAGCRFVDDARDVLRRIERATETARAIDRGEVGTLDVGLIGTAMGGVLPRILREHSRRFPSLRFRLHELTTRAQMARLREGVLDVAFLRPPPFDQEITFEPLWADAFVLVLPDDHPLAARACVDLADFANETFVMAVPHEAPDYYARSIELCRAYGFMPTAIQEADSVVTGVHSVAAGLGVLLAPSSLASQGWPGVVFRPLTGRTVKLVLAVAYRPDRARASLTRFLETVRQVVAAESAAR